MGTKKGFKVQHKHSSIPIFFIKFPIRNLFLFTVVCFALFMTSIAHAEGVIQLPQTGQTKCYDTAGKEIACATTGQDGEFQMGAAWPNPRFTDKGDQTVLDNLTGLIWTKDGNVMKTRDPSFDSDDTAGDGMVTWQHALDYIKKLNQENYQGHDDWRLPNVIELESLFHAGQSNSADWLNGQGFSNVQAYRYWSSSTYAGSEIIYAWVVHMHDGYTSNGRMYDFYYVWPVRGQSGSLDSSIISLPKTGQTTCYDASGSSISSIACDGTGQDSELQKGVAWPNPRFTNPGGTTPVNGNIVLDKLTGLEWTKDGNNKGRRSAVQTVARPGRAP